MRVIGWREEGNERNNGVTETIEGERKRQGTAEIQASLCDGVTQMLERA